MSTPGWFAEFERQEAMREERLDNIRVETCKRASAAGVTAHSREGRAFIRAVILHIRWKNYVAGSLADVRRLVDQARNGQLAFPTWGNQYHKGTIIELAHRLWVNESIR